MKKNLVTAAATAGLLFTAFGASASAQENTYTVQPGDSLWKIAQLHNVSIDNLKDWNQLSSDQIYVNQKLSISYTVKTGDSLWAIAQSQGTTVTELKSTNGLTTDLIQPGQQLKIPVPSVTVSAPAPATNNNPTSYVVQKGDSLSVIGARYNVTVSELKSMNQLTSNQILVGEILKLRSERAAANKAAAAAATEAQPAATSQETEKAAATANSTPTVKTQTASDAQASVTQAAPANSQTAVTPAATKPTAKTETTAPSQAAVTPAAAQSTVKTEPTAPSQAAVKSAATEPTVKPAASPTAPAASQPTVKPAPSQPAATQAPAASNVQAVITEAKQYIGVPYRWGGNTPAGFDCSGFVKYVFAKFGVSLPRTTESQWTATTPVNSPSIGDLVFFQTYKVGPSHVGIYLGNNKFISAASSGVTISDLTTSYWKTRYLGARKAF